MMSALQVDGNDVVVRGDELLLLFESVYRFNSFVAVKFGPVVLMPPKIVRTALQGQRHDCRGSYSEPMFGDNQDKALAGRM